MGLFDFLFGSPSKSVTTSTVQQAPTLTPEQQAALSMIFSLGTAFAPGAFQPFGFSPETFYSQVAGNLQTDLAGPMQALRGAIGQDFQQNLEQNIARQREDFANITLPQLRGGYAPSGFYSSERLGAENVLSRQFEEDIARMRSDAILKSREGTGQLAAILGGLQQSQAATQANIFQGAAGIRDNYRNQIIQALLGPLGVQASQPVVLQNTTARGGSSGILGGALGGILGDIFGGIF